MGRPQWTLLFVSDRDTTDVRQYRFSPDVLRLSIAFVFVAVAAVSSLATSYMVKARLPHYTAELREKNHLLTSELAAIQKQVVSLDTHLDNLAEQDEQFRLVAGLELLNEDVRRVGVGGPATERPGIAKLSKLDRNAADLASATNESVGELLRRARLLSYSWREAHNTLENKHEKWEATPSIVPTGGYLTSPVSRSRLHAVGNRARPRRGVRTSGAGGTAIGSAANGVARQAGYDGGCVYAVEIDHAYGGISRYAHASKQQLRLGQRVQRAHEVPLVGSSGVAS